LLFAINSGSRGMARTFPVAQSESGMKLRKRGCGCKLTSLDSRASGKPVGPAASSLFVLDFRFLAVLNAKARSGQRRQHHEFTAKQDYQYACAISATGLA
jgi:hypothetical protein